MLLQLLQQGGGVHPCRCHLSRCSEEIAITSFAKLHITNPLQQLLKFSAHAPENRFGTRCGFQPNAIRGLQPAFPQLLPPAAAALPEVRAWGEQVHLHLQQTGKRLNQLHLNWSKGTDAEQAQTLGQRRGIHLPLKQPLHGGAHLQAKGFGRQLPGQITPEQRLPVVLAAILLPLSQQIRPVQGVIVEGIGDGTGQLPAITAEDGCCVGAIPPLKPTT